MADRPDDALQRALEEGARRSREALVPDATVPAARDLRDRAADPTGPGPAAPVAGEALHRAVWRRHKWKIVGLVVLLVTELVLFIVGSTPRGP